MANGHPPNRKSSVKAMFVAATRGFPNPLEIEKDTEAQYDDDEEKHEKQEKQEKKKRRENVIWTDLFKDFLGMCLRLDPDTRADVPALQQHAFLKTATEQKELMAVLFRKIFAEAKS